MDDSQVELATLLARLGDLGDAIYNRPLQIDIHCLEVMRLSEAAHSIAHELLREVAHGG